MHDRGQGIADGDMPAPTVCAIQMMVFRHARPIQEISNQRPRDFAQLAQRRMSLHLVSYQILLALVKRVFSQRNIPRCEIAFDPQ